MTAAPEADTTVYQRSPGVLTRTTGGSVLLLIRGRDHSLLELAGSGAALWDALATPQSVDDCASRLAADYGIEPATVRAAIEPVLDELAVRGAVEVQRTAA